MSIAVKIFKAIETVVNGLGVIAGNRAVATELTLGGLKFDASFSITNSSGDNYNSDVIWATGQGGVNTFDLLWIELDAAGLVELTNDNGDTLVFSLAAGVPLLLSSDDLDSSGLGADGSATTVSQVITQIEVKNNTDGSSADVTITGRLLLLD